MFWALDGWYQDPEIGRKQAAVCAALRRAGIDPDSLCRALKQKPDTTRLALEHQAGQGWRWWKAVEPHYERFGKTYADAVRKLALHGLDFPPEAADLFCQFQEMISEPARRWRWMADAQGRRRYRRENPAMRARTRGPIAEVEPTAVGLRRHLRAVQQRYMPGIRVSVYKAIAAKTMERKNDRDGHVRACRLTADFLCAFYPAFGANTTPELVRKSLDTRRSRKVPTR